MTDIIASLKREMLTNLSDNILKFWMDNMVDDINGGFYGSISGQGEVIREAPKGAVLNARILWTFSAAYRLLGNSEYLEIATRAKRELIDRFYDNEFGGVYWSIDYLGNPLEKKKQIYALGFAIYGLSEYFKATSDDEALEYAKRLFFDIDKHSFDSKINGYCEALTRDWSVIEDMRLSAKDANESLTMNTHLHILEPYTNLFRVWKDEHLESRLKGLINIFTDKILDKQTSHLNLFFDEDWNSKYNTISYGHDIEASWLIHEASIVLGDKDLLAKVEPIIIDIANAASQGLVKGGGMIYEFDVDHSAIDAERHWWVQAEAVIGYYNLYQLTNDPEALDKVVTTWEFIKDRLVDSQNGEWYWSINADGSINKVEDKAGFWKCPYHNGRMCIEIIER